MDDRDKDLTGLFVRDLDEIPLPARAAWRGSKKGNTAVRASRLLLTAGAVVAVLAIALIAGSQLNQRQQGAVVASPSPTSLQATSGPSGKPTGTTCPLPNTSCGATGSTVPTTTGAYNDDFGFVLTSQGQGPTTTVRRESGARLGSFDQAHFAVSPDGRKIAYFTPAGTQPQELRLVGAADPERPQVLRTLSATERGGTIVWSNDLTGLLYQTYSVEPAPSPPSPPGNPALYAIHTFELFGTTTATSDRVVLASTIRGLVLEPIAWDRTANVAAVVETGEGGFMISYDVVRFTGNEAVTTKTPIGPPAPQMLAFSVVASSDAKLVLDATFENGGSLSWWPLADFGARRTIAGSRAGLWRPGTHEIATIGGCAGDPACGPNGGVRLLDVEKGTSRIVYGATVANMSLRAFRADGSALIVYAPQAPGAGTYEYTLVPLLGGVSPAIFTDVNGLIASVRLR